MIEVLSVFLLAFLLRIIPKFINNKINSDTWYHIACSDSISKNNNKIPSVLDGYLLPNGYNYPYLFHYILSYVSTKNLIKYERAVSAVVDSFLVTVSYGMFNQILNDANLSWNISILLALSPTLLKVSDGPRAYDLTPRVFGELLTLIYFLSLYQYYSSNELIFYAIALFFGALSFLSSKFSIQVIIIFSLFMALFLGSIEIFLSPIFVIIIAVIISGGRSVNLLSQQFTHLYKYATELKNIDGFVGQINSLNSYRLFFKLLVHLDFKNAYITLNHKLIYLNVVYKSFEFTVFSVILIIFGFDILNTDMLNADYLFSWVASGFLTFVIVGTNSFKFIGQAGRYLEYSIFPIYILLSVIMGDYFICFLLPGICLYFFNIFSYVYSRTYNLKDLYAATDFIKNNYDNNSFRLLGLLSHSSFYQGKILTGLDSITSSASEFSQSNWKDNLWSSYYSPQYPIRSNDLEWMYQKFGVNLILVYKPYLTALKLENDHEYSFDLYKEVYNQNGFLVYERI